MNIFQNLMNTYASHASATQSTLLSETVLVWSIVTAFFYFLPTTIAIYRGHKQSLSIFALDLLTSWTIVGWIGSLFWSVSNVGSVVKNKVVAPVNTDFSVQTLNIPSTINTVATPNSRTVYSSVNDRVLSEETAPTGITSQTSL